MLRPALASVLIATQASHAATSCLVDAMIVFDGSGSMSEVGIEATIPRIDEARDAVAEAMPRVERFRELGLLIYGPGSKSGCENIDLRFAPRPHAAEAITEAIDSLTPGGMTPLTKSVQTAAEILDYQSQPATVVLVTDGNETCGGTPCRLGRQLEEAGRDLTIHVIGYRFRYDFRAWDNPDQDEVGPETVARCLADQTGGVYVSTETVDELVEALNQTLGCALIGWADPRKSGLPKKTA